MTYDLEYTLQGFFVSFLPNTKAGEDAWREIAMHTGGTGKILKAHLASTLQQLRAAGYTVRKAPKAPKMTQAEHDKILSELDELIEGV